MFHAVVVARHPLCFGVRAAANNRPHSQAANKSQRQKPTTTTGGFGGKKKDPVWQCIDNCGACCKLDKGPNFPSPEEIFQDLLISSNSKAWLVKMGGAYTMTRPQENVPFMLRPYFCRVDPETFDFLYGIDKKKFNKEACSSCVDTIKAVYGTDSEELEKFNHAIWSTTSR